MLLVANPTGAVLSGPGSLAAGLATAAGAAVPLATDAGGFGLLWKSVKAKYQRDKKWSEFTHRHH